MQITQQASNLSFQIPAFLFPTPIPNVEVTKENPKCKVKWLESHLFVHF
jgi:hypothetical protein